MNRVCFCQLRIIIWPLDGDDNFTTIQNPYAQGGNQSDLNGSDNLTEYDIKTRYNTVDNAQLWSTCAESIIVLCSLSVSS